MTSLSGEDRRLKWVVEVYISKITIWPIYKDLVYSVSSQKIQWGWASAIWQLDSLFDTVRIVCGAGSIKRSGVTPSVCQSVPSVECSSDVWRVCCWAPYAQKISIDSAGRRQQQRRSPGPQHGAQQQMRAISCWQPNYQGWTQTWVTFYFRPIKILAVFTACLEFVSGWQHAQNYISTHWTEEDLDGSTDKNLPYFVVENMATLARTEVTKGQKRPHIMPALLSAWKVPSIYMQQVRSPFVLGCRFLHHIYRVCHIHF